MKMKKYMIVKETYEIDNYKYSFDLHSLRKELKEIRKNLKNLECSPIIIRNDKIVGFCNNKKFVYKIETVH